MSADIYPECEHNPPCCNGVGPCYSGQAAVDRLRNDFPLMRDDVQPEEIPPFSIDHMAAVARYNADRIADDAIHIHELLQVTGLTPAEYALLRNEALNVLPPRTYNLKGDDWI